MKARVILLLLIGLVLLGAGEYRQNAGEVRITFTTNDAAGTTADSGTIGLGKVGGFSQSIMAQFILLPAIPTYAGLGNQDSARLTLWTSFGGRRETIVAETCGTCPCSLYYASTAAALDTILKDEIGLDYWIIDSLGDSAFDVTYRLRKNLLLK